MLLPMIVLTVLGVMLLLSAPWLARTVMGEGSDPVALTRILQATAVLLLLIALLVRPWNPATTAFPPPPDAAEVER